MSNFQNQSCRSGALLIHGYGESVEVWDSVLSLLPFESVEMVYLSQLFEQSDIDASFESLATLIISQLNHSVFTAPRCVVANSMGGYFALELLRQAPHLFKMVFLISSHPFADDEKRKKQREKEIMLIDAGRSELIGHMFASKWGDRSDEVERMWQSWSPDALKAALRAMMMRDTHVQTVLCSEVPIHFIVGACDTAIDHHNLSECIDASQTSTIHVIRGCGHGILLENPSEIVRIINEYIGA